jgi:IrrE N-terminal-like domain
MPAKRRARSNTAITHLPRWGYVIKEKHLRRFRTLIRQLTTTPMDGETTFDGLLHMGEEGNEIWVEAGLSEPEKRFTIIHELVHARRQRAGEDLDDDRLEEPIVELEAIARAGRRTLRRMPSGMILSVLHDFLTRCERDDPETPEGLQSVYRRIRTLLGLRGARLRGRVLSSPAAVARHKRPRRR